MNSKWINWIFVIMLVAGLLVTIQGFQEVEKEALTTNYFPGNNELTLGTNNLVTGIYLDIRLYDTIFETAILFVAATGIIFIVKKDEDMLDR